LPPLITAPEWPALYALGVAVAHFAMASGVTVHALIRKRDVPATIGWIGIAWFAPVIGALLYVGFGINRVKRRARKLKGEDRSSDSRVTGDPSSADPIERLKVVVGAITRQDIASGKVVAILDSGDQGYPQMLSAIEGARSSISMCTYIFRTDELGQQFVDALAGAHRRGVKVRVLIDGFGGGFLFSSAYHHLRRQGVPAARFLHSLLPWQMPLLDLRLHKKCLVVDGASAFVGGLNIGAENLVKTDPRAPVRDCHFRLEGTIVRQLEQQFDEDWAFTTRQAPLAAQLPASAPDNDSSPTRAIVTGPDQDFERLVLVLQSAVNAARRSIWIATPYFLPDESLVTALALAAMRSVAVNIVIPAVNNHRLVGWAVWPHIRPLLLAGCRMWKSPPPFDHAKLMTVDGEWSLVGSANWDTRSLRLNFELTVEVYDREFAASVSQRIEARCLQPITLAEIDRRPWLFQLRDAAARLAIPYI